VADEDVKLRVQVEQAEQAKKELDSVNASLDQIAAPRQPAEVPIQTEQIAEADGATESLGETLAVVVAGSALTNKNFVQLNNILGRLVGRTRGLIPNLQGITTLLKSPAFLGAAAVFGGIALAMKEIQRGAEDAAAAMEALKNRTNEAKAAMDALKSAEEQRLTVLAEVEAELAKTGMPTTPGAVVAEARARITRETAGLPSESFRRQLAELRARQFEETLDLGPEQADVRRATERRRESLQEVFRTGRYQGIGGLVNRVEDFFSGPAQPIMGNNNVVYNAPDGRRGVPTSLEPVP